MEIKQNEATRNRPEGARILDAPWVFTDLNSITAQLVSENAWKKNDRNGITIFKTDRLTLVVTALKAGAEIKDNLIDGMLMLQVLSGNISIDTGGEIVELKSGGLLNLHEYIYHSIIAHEDSMLLLSTYQ